MWPLVSILINAHEDVYRLFKHRKLPVIRHVCVIVVCKSYSYCTVWLLNQVCMSFLSMIFFICMVFKV